MAKFIKTIIEAVKGNQHAASTLPVHTIKNTCNITSDKQITTLEAEIFNLKKAREATLKPPAVSIPNSQPTVPAQLYQGNKNPAYAPPVDRNVAVQYKLNKEKRPKPAYKTLPPVHDPTIAENVYKRSIDAPITVTQVLL
jgi:hypothetical protein